MDITHTSLFTRTTSARCRIRPTSGDLQKSASTVFIAPLLNPHIRNLASASVT